MIMNTRMIIHIHTITNTHTRMNTRMIIHI